jgi:hypothetical protein
MIQNEIVDTAWGAPLKPEETTLVIDAEGEKKTLGEVFNTLPIRKGPLNDVISHLTSLADMIEGDMEYFNKFQGQSMAINRLAMIKGLILREVKTLKSL